jgi:polyamine oxidase
MQHVYKSVFSITRPPRSRHLGVAMPCLRQLLPFLLLSTSVYGSTIRAPRQEGQARPSSDFKVIILGGGVAGVIAARTLHENGIDNYVIVEARDELGGRLKSTDFAGTTVELGANWVQGTQTKGGPANPILTLVQKHNVSTQFNDLYGSMSKFLLRFQACAVG